MVPSEPPPQIVPEIRSFLYPACSMAGNRHQADHDLAGADGAGTRREDRAHDDDGLRQAAGAAADPDPQRAEQAVGDAGAFEDRSHEDEQRDLDEDEVAGDVDDAAEQLMAERGAEDAEAEQQRRRDEGEGDREAEKDHREQGGEHQPCSGNGEHARGPFLSSSRRRAPRARRASARRLSGRRRRDCRRRAGLRDPTAAVGRITCMSVPDHLGEHLQEQCDQADRKRRIVRPDQRRPRADALDLAGHEARSRLRSPPPG